MNHRRQYLLFAFLLFTLSIQTMAARQFSALVFADAFDQWHYPNVPVAKEAFTEMSGKHAFAMDWVDSDKAFARKTYSDYDVIVFVSASPCGLEAEKRKEFQDYVRNGGAVVSVHWNCTGANAPNRWDWWETLLGRAFLHHPPQQSAVINVVDPDFPACLHLPEKWLWTDEWYVFEVPFPDHLNVVLTVDESTYYPQERDLMGDPHPIAWYHEFEGGRVFYTAIGHISESYRDANFLQHIFGGMLWAVGERDPQW